MAGYVVPGILAGGLLLSGLIVKNNKTDSRLVKVMSTVDGKTYEVRDLPDKQAAADMLARLRGKMERLKNVVGNSKDKDQPRVKRLMSKFNGNNLAEAPYDPDQTSYSINKGEKIYLCIRNKKHNNEIIDENTLTFVAFHEMAHVMTKSVGHTDEFWANFKFLLQHAVPVGLYRHENYTENPRPYCGIQVSDTPLSDPTIVADNFASV